MPYIEVQIGLITVNNEPWLVRSISVASGVRVAEFRDTVHQRDRRYVITGELVLHVEYGIWRGFEAAHIFPLEYRGLGPWNWHDYGHWITFQPDTGGCINSV